VGGLAPYHGRLLVLDRDNAGESTGHGAPLPHPVHGGPGRARGGEELGGIRAVLHLMQVTSVSASPAMVTAVTGRWTPGAPTTGDTTHPFRRHFEELRIGGTLRTPSRTVTLEDIERFADLSGDRFYAHMDEAAAKANPCFDGRVAHGHFVVSAAAGLFVDPDPGPCLAQLRPGAAAIPQAGLPRRHPDGVADLQAEDGQGRRGLRRGPLGRRRREPGRREGRHLRRLTLVATRSTG
jgi:oxepin-CoA hydrolase / 3-oxo-5,6-dehydrosuberyl-CoA semialdehyde dehydrogenase